MNAFHSISSWWKRFSRKRRLSMLNATDNVEDAPLSKYTLVSRDRALGAWSKEGTVITLFTEVTAYPD